MHSSIEFPYDDIESWDTIDNDHIIPNDSGIEIITKVSV